MAGLDEARRSVEGQRVCSLPDQDVRVELHNASTARAPPKPKVALRDF